MTVEDRIRRRLGGRGAAYLELTKPGIALFVVATAAAGYVMAALADASLAEIGHLGLGIGLCTAGALAMNQYLERGPDALMVRTRRRPVPSGRIPAGHAHLFAWVLTLAGVGHLWFWLGWLPALVAALSAFLYNAVYTPLKLRTPASTPVGAVPGALPALVGWTAHAGTVDPGGAALFGIVFLWQIVHVLALGWNLRQDYALAGFRLIPPGPPERVARWMVVHVVLLLPASLAPVALGMSGRAYLAGALVLGLALLAATIAFRLEPTGRRCSGVFFGSLAYHPLLLTAMVADAL